jgi:hypothetical protein
MLRLPHPCLDRPICTIPSTHLCSLALRRIMDDGDALASIPSFLRQISTLKRAIRRRTICTSGVAKSAFAGSDDTTLCTNSVQNRDTKKENGLWPARLAN